MMKHTICIAADCHKGLVRSINQDNFWCADRYLEMVNEGLEAPVVAEYTPDETPTAAVFDGMGGEQFGEHASYIASSTYHELYHQFDVYGEDDFFNAACSIINGRICEHGAELKVGNMGTTGAMILFSKEHVRIANVGDSRIYRISGSQMTQISVDHCMECPGRKKAPLTQFLGIPETEFIIQPHIAKFPLEAGDRYLLCSDGLTDMVEEEQILAMIKEEATVEAACTRLREAALAGGGRDNITVIVCEVVGEKTKRSFWDFFKRKKK